MTAQRGQTTLEWLGIGAVVIAIALALVSAAPVAGESVAERFRCLVHAITSTVTGAATAGCGEATSTEDGSDGGSGQDGGAGDDSGQDEPELTPLEQATQGDYIAIGDSFASGEGAGDFDDSECHRSANGYPTLIGEAYDFGGDVVNVTCSGATIANVNGESGQHGEDPQIQAITEDASLITIGISGNDTGWTDVISSCATDGSIGGDICGDTEAIRANMAGAVEDFDALLEEIMAGDHDARVIAVGYPRFFPEPPEEEWTYGCNPFGCLARISVEEQQMMNDLFREYNDMLRAAAEANDVEFIDVHDAFDGCELTTSSACMNGLNLDGGFEWPPASANPGSFHPNADGHQVLADLVQDQIEDP